MDLPFKKKSYAQRYRSEWENEDEFKGWLKPASGDSTKAFCTYCCVEILAKLFDIQKHAKTKKHKQKLELKTGRCSEFYFTSPHHHNSLYQSTAGLKASPKKGGFTHNNHHAGQTIGDRSTVL